MTSRLIFRFPKCYIKSLKLLLIQRNFEASSRKMNLKRHLVRVNRKQIAAGSFSAEIAATVPLS